MAKTIVAKPGWDSSSSRSGKINGRIAQKMSGCKNWFRGMQRQHGETIDHLMQVLIRHGCFGKKASKKCWYCEEEQDSAEYTMLHCKRWRKRKLELTGVIVYNMILISTHQKSLGERCSKATRNRNWYQVISVYVIRVKSQDKDDDASFAGYTCSWLGRATPAEYSKVL